MSDAVKMRETFRSVLRATRMSEAVTEAYRAAEAERRRRFGFSVLAGEIAEVRRVQETVVRAATLGSYAVIEVAVRKNGVAYDVINTLIAQQWLLRIPLAPTPNTDGTRTLYTTLGPQLFRATADSPDNDNEFMLFILDSADKETTLDAE